MVNKTQVVRVDYNRSPLLYVGGRLLSTMDTGISGYFHRISECKNDPKSSTFNEVHAQCDTCHQLDKCSAVGKHFALGSKAMIVRNRRAG